jgi:hypothetical protein
MDNPPEASDIINENTQCKYYKMHNIILATG